jgi:tripartite ATP-independent transporter DctM subunit
VTGRLQWRDVPPAMFRAAVTTGVVAILIAFASAVTFLLSIDLVPQRLTAFLQGLTRDPLVFIWLVMAVLVFVGMFLESNAAYIMLVPLLAPIAELYGLDPLHFGFVFILNLVIGMLTPPVGVLLFVVSSARQVPLNSLLANVWPFIAVQFAVLVLCVQFPAIVTWLPRQLGY